jgi:hypothetical protein
MDAPSTRAMVHVFRLGPILHSGRPAFAYVGVDEQGAVLREVAHTDAEGFRAMVAAARDQPLRCEPSRAEAGEPFQIESAPLPETILPVRATLAYEYAFGLGNNASAPSVLLRFLKASSGS